MISPSRDHVVVTAFERQPAARCTEETAAIMSDPDFVGARTSYINEVRLAKTECVPPTLPASFGLFSRVVFFKVCAYAIQAKDDPTVSLTD